MPQGTGGMGTGSDVRIYNPRGESSYMFRNNHEEDTYSPESGKEKDKRIESKQKKRQKRRGEMRNLKHILVKPSDLPPAEEEEREDESEKLDRELEPSLMTGSAGSRGYLTSVATQARGPGAAHGGQYVAMGEPMDMAWRLLKMPNLYLPEEDMYGADMNRYQQLQNILGQDPAVTVGQPRLTPLPTGIMGAQFDEPMNYINLQTEGRLSKPTMDQLRAHQYVVPTQHSILSDSDDENFMNYHIRPGWADKPQPHGLDSGYSRTATSALSPAGKTLFAQPAHIPLDDPTKRFMIGGSTPDMRGRTPEERAAHQRFLESADSGEVKRRGAWQASQDRVNQAARELWDRKYSSMYEQGKSPFELPPRPHANATRDELLEWYRERDRRRKAWRESQPKRESRRVGVRAKPGERTSRVQVVPTKSLIPTPESRRISEARREEQLELDRKRMKEQKWREKREKGRQKKETMQERFPAGTRGLQREELGSYRGSKGPPRPEEIEHGIGAVRPRKGRKFKRSEPMDIAWDSLLLKRDERQGFITGPTKKPSKDKKKRAKEKKDKKERGKKWRPSTGPFEMPPGGMTPASATGRRAKARMRGIKGGKKTGLSRAHLAVEMSHRGVKTKQPKSKDPKEYRKYRGQQEGRQRLGRVRTTYSTPPRFGTRAYQAGPTGAGLLQSLLPGQSEQMRRPALKPHRPPPLIPPRMPHAPQLPQLNIPSPPPIPQANRGVAVQNMAEQTPIHEPSRLPTATVQTGERGRGSELQKKGLSYYDVAELRQLVNEARRAMKRKESKKKGKGEKNVGAASNLPRHTEAGPKQTTRPEGATEDATNEPRTFGINPLDHLTSRGGRAP